MTTARTTVVARAVAATLIAVAAPVTTSAMVSASAPPSGSVAAGCTEVTAMLDALWGIGVSMLNEDGAALESTINAVPDAVAAAAGAAPAELAEALAQLQSATADLLANLEGVDLTDGDAVAAAFGEDDPATEEASDAVETWATDNCGWTAPEFDFPQVDEPAECTELDAAAAATAAGLEPTSDSTFEFDLNFGIVWVKACNYANGLTLGTFTYTDADDAREMILENATGSVVLEGLDLGALPATTFAYAIEEADPASTSASSSAPDAMPPSVHVVVFDTEIPFEVQLDGEASDELVASVIAAANALYAAQSDGAPSATSADSTPSSTG